MIFLKGCYAVSTVASKQARRRYDFIIDYGKSQKRFYINEFYLKGWWFLSYCVFWVTIFLLIYCVSYFCLSILF